MFSQSLGAGPEMLTEATRRHIGLSSFVSTGQQADVSVNDMLQFWSADPETDVVLLSLAGIDHPSKFARLVRRVSAEKVVVAIESGLDRITVGPDNPGSTVPQESAAALVQAAGIIAVRTPEEMFDVALLLAAAPLPRGDRVAVVGHAAAVNHFTAAQWAAHGLVRCRSFDVGVDTTTAAFVARIAEAIAVPDIDAVVVLSPPPRPGGDDVGVADLDAVRDVVRGTDKPVVTTFVDTGRQSAELAPAGDIESVPASVPTYPSAERAMAALGQVVRHAAWRRAGSRETPDSAPDSK